MLESPECEAVPWEARSLQLGEHCAWGLCCLRVSAVFDLTSQGPFCLPGGSDRTRRNRLRLKGGRFPLDTRKKFSPLRVVRHCKRSPREVTAVPYLETFQVVLFDLQQPEKPAPGADVPAHGRGVGTR